MINHPRQSLHILILLVILSFTPACKHHQLSDMSVDLKIKGDFVINLYNTQDKLYEVREGTFNQPLHVDVVVDELIKTEFKDTLVIMENKTVTHVPVNEEDSLLTVQFVTLSTIYIDSVVFKGKTQNNNDYEINHSIAIHTQHDIAEIKNNTDTLKHKVTTTRNWDVTGEIESYYKDSIFRYVLLKELSGDYTKEIVEQSINEF